MDPVSLEAAAGQIKIWIEVKLSKMPWKHQQQMSPLRNALRDFAALLEPLDADVTGMFNKAKSSGDVPFSVKFSSLWNEQKMKEYLDDLRWQANAIHFLLSATQLVPEESIKRIESITYAASLFREGSLFNDSGSTIDNLEFEFNHLLINTATYRRALKSHVQRPRDLSEVPTNTKVDDDLASYISRAKMRGDRLTAVHLAGESGQTKILRESENNHESTIKLLLEHGAESLPDNQGHTPLPLAAAKPGAEPVVNCFLNQLGCKTLPVEDSELTPLHIAACEGRYDLMEHILGGGLADIRDKNDISLIHCACAWNQLQFVKFLLGLKVDVNARGNWLNSTSSGERASMTSLGLAIRFKNPELVQLLLGHGASQENAY